MRKIEITILDEKEIDAELDRIGVSVETDEWEAISATRHYNACAVEFSDSAGSQTIPEREVYDFLKEFPDNAGHEEFWAAVTACYRHGGRT